jgi:hypothetical protein
MSIEKEMNALEAVIDGGISLMKEALERKADIKQGRLASEVMGRVNGATKNRLEYRLNRQKLVEMEARMIEGETVEPAPERIDDAPARAAIPAEAAA